MLPSSPSHSLAAGQVIGSISTACGGVVTGLAADSESYWVTDFSPDAESKTTCLSQWNSAGEFVTDYSYAGVDPAFRVEIAALGLTLYGSTGVLVTFDALTGDVWNLYPNGTLTRSASPQAMGLLLGAVPAPDPDGGRFWILREKEPAVPDAPKTLWAQRYDFDLHMDREFPVQGNVSYRPSDGAAVTAVAASDDYLLVPDRDTVRFYRRADGVFVRSQGLSGSTLGCETMAVGTSPDASVFMYLNSANCKFVVVEGMGQTAVAATDADGDGILDTTDNCPAVANADQADWDGDGRGDLCDPDIDGDTILNESDNCPRKWNTDQKDTNGNGVGDACDDGDRDGIIDIADNCPAVANADQKDSNSNGVGDACESVSTDTDRDGITDARDNCPAVANADQRDADANGIGDACDDRDHDGITDLADNCPAKLNPDQRDTDGNGVGDVCQDTDRDGRYDLEDNCPAAPNPDQADQDSDHIGDVCDPDLDGDTILNATDNCPAVVNTDQQNTDGDALGNACDPDDDNDTVLDQNDNCPVIANSTQANYDKDALGDACDPDADNDGVPNASDPYPLGGDPPGTTQTGTNIPVQPTDPATGTAPATLTFSNVTTAGTTTVTSSGTGTPPPAGFKLGNPPIYYDLATTATFSGTITVCFKYTPTAFSKPGNLKLFHGGASGWTDVTTSNNVSTGTICGNVTSLSPFVFAELRYDFVGFFAPVDNNGVLNQVKAGAAVPIKFGLGGSLGLDIFSAGPTATSMSCPLGGTVDAIEETVAASTSGLTYDPVTGQYVYVWKTDKGWAGKCQKLSISLKDGTVKTALFQFTK
jgi:hypothetical protein